MLGLVIEIGRSRVVEMPHVGNRFTHLMARGYVKDVNLRSDGAIREKRRTLSWKEREE
jgi:hypothetical protein